MSRTVWSDYQKAIFEDVKSGNGHTIVVARAGSGKTTALIECLNYVSPNDTVLLAAFNKAIVNELKERAPSYVNCFTLHAIGYKAIKQHLNPNVVLDRNKTFKIVQELLPKSLQKKNSSIAFTLITCRAISLCKSYLVDTPSKIDELLDKFNLDGIFFDRKEYAKFIIKCLGLCKKQTDRVDYDDMIYFPFIYRLPVDKYRRVFIDEAQDLNLPQLYMVIESCEADGRICVFGDDKQALYFWRGSDADALKRLKETLKAKELPLPISYRCAKNIIKLAQKFVPDICARPNAPEGWVINLPEDDLFKHVKPGDFVLSRTNAPLISYCLHCLQNKIPANIQGKDISLQLTSLILKSKKATTNSFLNWLEEWKKSEIERLIKRRRDPESVYDTVDSFKYLCQGTSSLKEVKDKIHLLFSSKEDEEQITFSNVHQAKGLERSRAFLLMRTFKSYKNQEEKNIEYVAITRAKEELFLLY